jgi:hypothetical protein
MITAEYAEDAAVKRKWRRRRMNWAGRAFTPANKNADENRL